MDGLIEHFAKVEPTFVSVASRRPRVVIIGAGFGGLSAAMSRSTAPSDACKRPRRLQYARDLLPGQPGFAQSLGHTGGNLRSDSP